MKRGLSSLLLFLLVLTCLLPVTALAANDPYTYTVRVFAGNMGTIGGEDVVVSQIVYDEEAKSYPAWSFDISSVQVTNDKYYVKGIRESGKDNDTVAPPYIDEVSQDMDFVVAYGVKGDEVAYTVRFVRDSNGTQLADPVTYYGNIGDKPVVACKHIPGFYPRYYNITGTLKENAAENEFVFRYEPMPVTTAETTVVGPAPAVVNPNNQNNANRPAANTPAGGTGGAGDSGEPAPGGEAFPPQPENILDMDVPLAGTTEQNGSGNLSGGMIAGITGGSLLVLLMLLLFLLKKKREEEEAVQPEPHSEDEPKE